MNILLFRHYPPAEGASMRLFANNIAEGLRARGHTVKEITAPVLLGRIDRSKSTKAKWLGYIDQFIFFPSWLWILNITLPPSILCVFVDQALGPWIHLLKSRPHVVHCHDLLAMEAAMNLQAFHKLNRTGVLYQRWIRHGFRQARFFLSVSYATRCALEKQLQRKPIASIVLHNPLSNKFTPLAQCECMSSIEQALPRLGQQPYLFHIGQNWYKNRLGLLAIWEQLNIHEDNIHLVMVGPANQAIKDWIHAHQQLRGLVHILDHASDKLVISLYSQAEALVFPSHAEGFGWPILEALACGCPVITTDAAPMNEVGGQSVVYIPPFPQKVESQSLWAQLAAKQVLAVLQRSTAQKEVARRQGFKQTHLFEYERWLDKLEKYYENALALQGET